MDENLRAAAEQTLIKRAQEVEGKDLHWGGNVSPMPPDPLAQADMQAEAQKQITKQVRDTDTEFINNWRATSYQQQFVNGQYVNQVLGPDGAELPQGAEGWDYYGRPFYGTGLKGWFNGFKSAIADQEPGEITPATTTQFIPQLGGEGQVTDVGQWWENLKAGSAGGAIGKAARGTSAIVGGVLNAFDVPARTTEQALNVGRSAGASAMSGRLQNPNPVSNWAQYLPQSEVEASAQYWNDYFKTHKSTLAGWFSDSFENGGIRKFGEMDTAWQAGRILYSTAGAGLTNAEFERRYRDGESPYLLAQELENPGAELAGRLLIDPLNVIGTGVRSVDEGRTIRNIRDEYYTIPGKLGEMLRGGDALNEGRAFQATEQMVFAQMENSRKAAQGLTDLANRRGLFNLTADGKRFVVNRRAAELSSWIVRNARDPDQAGEMLKALALLASDAPDEVQSGLELVKHFPDSIPLVSEAGNELGVILRRLIGEVEDVRNADMLQEASVTMRLNAAGFLTELKNAQENGVDEVIRLVNRRLEAAVDQMYPSVDEMAAAAKKVKQGGDLTEREIELAQAYADLGYATKAATAAAKKMNVVYRPVNSFFAAIYMGYSPGYAFRNFLTNSFHVAVDQGASAIFVRPEQAINGTAELLGGQIPAGVAGFGHGVQGAEEISDMGKGSQVFRRLSEKFEEWGAAQVVYASVKRTMGKMLRPGKAIPDIKVLTDAGMPEAAARSLVRLVIDNKGDVDKATRLFIDQAKTGSIDTFRAMTWIADQDREVLESISKWDELHAGLQQAETREDALAIIRKIKEDLYAEARRAGQELPGVDEAADGSVELAAASDELSDISIKLEGNSENANIAAREAIEAASSDILNGVGAKATATGDQNLIAAVEQLRQSHMEMTQQAQDITRDYTEWRARWTQWYKNIERTGDRNNLNFTKLWGDLGMESHPPTSYGEFTQRFWEEFFYPVSTEYTQRAREILYKDMQNLKTTLGVHGRSIDAAERANNLARTYEQLRARYQQARYKIVDAEKAGNFIGARAMLAWQYGLNPWKENGFTNITMLKRTINKWLPEGVGPYDKLEDIPLEAARQALARRLEDISGKIATGVENTAVGSSGHISLYHEAEALSREITSIATRHVDSYPPALEEAVKAEASFMHSLIANAEAGRRIQLPDGSWTKEASSFPDFYDEVQWGKNNVLKALENVMAGGVLDAGKRDAQIKYLILQRLLDINNPNANPLVMLHFGYEQQAYELALRLLDEDADLVKLFGEDGADRLYALLAKDPSEIRQGTPLVLGYRDGMDIDELLAPVPSAVEISEGAQLPKSLEQLQAEAESLTEEEIAQLEASVGQVTPERQAELAAEVEASKARARKAIEDNDLTAIEAHDAAQEKMADAVVNAAPAVQAPSQTPSPAQAAAGNYEGMLSTLRRVERGVNDNWGKTETIIFNRNVNNELTRWANQARRQVAEARLIATQVADKARDFTLLSYPEKRNADLALAYLYPYHFWYGRTYKAWMKRVVTNPEVIAAYAKYREYMEQIHAGAPDWWKYNVNSNELLGLDKENPLFFNLEATLNPLNGLTGVDFNDPEKRLGWWTNTLDDLNKFGPSTWTPYNLATAFALYMQGEDDAASRWAGRLLPQSAALKSGLSMANVNIPTRQGVNEFDPSVLVFSNGMDSYERRRVGRALGWMVDEGEITQEQAMDAARTQEGDIWREATERAIRARAGGQLASFFGGVGFKGRSRSDMMIDRADTDWRRIWAMSDTLSPDELRDMLDQHRQQFPFHEAVILSRKGGLDRDRSYAYNVLSRVPPGQKNSLAELVGISGDMFDIFYATKGNLDQWADTDRERFMAGIVDLGAILSMPDDATQSEWNDASRAYKVISDQGARLFGEDIWDKVDLYYAYRQDQGEEIANAYLAENPDISNALNWKDGVIVNDPLLSRYYGAIYRVERYYKNLMYDAIKAEVGADIFDKWDEYSIAKLEGRGKEYWNDHPELARYTELKDKYAELYGDSVARVAKNLKDPTYPPLRQDADLSSLGQQAIAEQMNYQERTPYDYTWDEWKALMSPQLSNLLLDYALRGDDLPNAAQDQLDYIANGLDIDPGIMLQLIEQSVGY